jgi:hypothetical protein|tara:strand:+ start:682 stop:837 length:156 start_codon:yes stop_codon:yes gene_type:complete
MIEHHPFVKKEVMYKMLGENWPAIIWFRDVLNAGIGIDHGQSQLAKVRTSC